MPSITRFDDFKPSKQERAEFDCGNEEVTRWLRQYASQAMASRDAVVYLLHDEREIIGFFSLSSGSVTRAQAGAQLGKHAPDPVPMILLGRMGVHLARKGAGFGAELLREAMLRAAASARDIAARGLMLHAIDDDARSFYDHFGFEESPISPRLMLMSFSDLETTLTSISGA